MSADFNTEIIINGTKEELRSLLNVIEKYKEGSKDVYVNLFSLKAENKDELLAFAASQEDIAKYLESADGKLTVEASGPYGSFGFLNEVDLFENMAIATPNADFEGHMWGFNNFGRMSYDGKLMEGKLHLFFTLEENGTDDEEESDADFIAEKISYKEFINCLGVDEDSFPEDNYWDFLEESVDDGEVCDADEFEEWFDITVDAAKYSSLQNRIARLLSEFEEDDEVDAEETIFDPINKKYL